jgi:hypothetical protein
MDAVKRYSKLGVLAVSLLLMGSTVVKCTSGENGLHFVGATGDDNGNGSGNSAPVAQGFTFQASPNMPASGNLEATDADGDTLTFSIVAGPTLGTLELTDPGTGAFTYTASALTGVDSFSYQASDGDLDSAVAVVTVEIGAGAAMALTLPTRADTAKPTQTLR